MTEKFTRDLKWGSQYGVVKTVKELDDGHVLNIIKYLPKSHHAEKSHFADLYTLFLDEAKIRGLELQKDYLPHLGPDGTWMIWDEAKGVSVPVPVQSDLGERLAQELKEMV